MPGQTAPDQIDLLKLPRLQEQFFPAGAGKENIDGRIGALIADFTIEHHFHIPCAFKLLKDELIHPTAGFDQRRRHDRERACFFRVAGGREYLSRNLHRAGIDAAAHSPTAAGHGIIKCTCRPGN